MLTASERCRERLMSLIHVYVVSVLLACLFLAFHHRHTAEGMAMSLYVFLWFPPLLQILYLRYRFCAYGNLKDTSVSFEEDVAYQLSGNVVKAEKRESLQDTGTDLFEVKNFEIQRKVEEWYREHKDLAWYQAGCGPFVVAILKAIFNAYSMISKYKRYDWKTRLDQPGVVGTIWVVTTELSGIYMILCVFLVASRNVFMNRNGGKFSVHAVSGSLKSMGRFSALNLLEFIRVDDFADQDRMRKMISFIGGIIGFMAFRCKVAEIAFVIHTHVLEWKLEQLVRVLALINNMASITDRKEKMSAFAIESRGYRKDRWIRAVERHLVNFEWQQCGPSAERPGIRACLAIRRMVSMGPEDVNRLLEDLKIEYKYDDRPELETPKEFWDDCWNFQLTNIFGSLRLAMWHMCFHFDRRWREHWLGNPEHPKLPLQQGKVNRVAEVQKIRAGAVLGKQEADAHAEMLQSELVECRDRLKVCEARMKIVEDENKARYQGP